MQIKEHTLLTRQRGYSLLEILIVLVVIGLALTAVAGNIPATLATMEPEVVMTQTAAVMLQARTEALRGVVSETKRTFRIEDTLALPHNGVEITSTPPSYGQANCNTNSCPNQQTICVSGQPICFTSNNSFIFERHSGKLSKPYAMFITNKRRSLGLMISASGDLTVVELVQGQWHSRTDLQQLIKTNQTTKEQPTNTGK